MPQNVMGNGSSGAPKEPTMADVADYLGVSRQLVSLVLRDQPGPSERTRERVRKAADELGYRPHFGAQLLRQSRSTRLGVGFTPHNINEGELIEEMYPAARAAGYGLILSAQTPKRGTERVLAELLGHRCAGVVLIGSTLPSDELTQLVRQSTVPVTMVSSGVGHEDFDVVRSAGTVGIAQCVEHLHGLGHRDIAYIDTPSIDPAPERLEGYLEACGTLDVKPRVESHEVGLPEEEGAAAARSLLNSGAVPTAIACANDQTALGASMVLLEAGLQIPRDVSITGYDDSRIATWSFMELTSARQDPAELGAQAVAAVLRRVDDPSLAPGEFVIQPSLVVRGSTAPPTR